MPTTRKLTRRQQQILDYVTTWIRERGYPPTVREIAESFGIKSPNGVHTHLRTLEKKGYLQRDRGKSRGIRPTGEFQVPLVVPMVRSERPEEVERPERAPGRVTLDRTLVGPTLPEFVLRVGPEVERCPSVQVGDYLLLRSSSVPIPGDLVAWVRDGRVVLERLPRDAPGGTPWQEPEGLLGVVQGIFRRV